MEAAVLESDETITHRSLPDKHGHGNQTVYHTKHDNLNDSNFSDSSSGDGVTFSH